MVLAAAAGRSPGLTHLRSASQQPGAETPGMGRRAGHPPRKQPRAPQQPRRGSTQRAPAAITSAARAARRYLYERVTAGAPPHGDAAVDGRAVDAASAGSPAPAGSVSTWGRPDPSLRPRPGVCAGPPLSGWLRTPARGTLTLLREVCRQPGRVRD